MVNACDHHFGIYLWQIQEKSHLKLKQNADKLNQIIAHQGDKYMKTIAYILGGIFVFFGVLFVWASFGDAFIAGWFLTGLVTVGVGFGVIWFASRRKPSEISGANVTLKLDLPADVKLKSLKCQSCGGSLNPENITMVNGAPVVNCPYCKTTYQLTEEPKW
jgi:hypothetical protein